jgi:omega-6 fatty acid desaturase (delta-12 desaturase)
MMLVGPSLVFCFERRFPQRGMSKRILLSVHATNLALVGWAVGWSALVGWETFLLVQGTTLVAGGAIAAWMLYVQHQYEETYYQAPENWQFELAALKGSSYLELPRALTWIVGNANYHHVHHLSAKIPNYNLRAAHEEQPMFRETPVVTVRNSVAALRLKLWDEESQALVRFAPIRQRSELEGPQVRAPVVARRRPLVALWRERGVRGADRGAAGQQLDRRGVPAVVGERAQHRVSGDDLGARPAAAGGR